MESGITREEIIDVTLCFTCLKIMVLFHWTQEYIKAIMK